MKLGLLIGLVVLIQHASSFRLGCGCGVPFVGGQCSHGCGIQFPYRSPCEGSNLIRGDDWCSNGVNGDNKDCVPVVVRPHDLPKPVVAPQVAIELSKPVAGPCAVKKAIVKPAVLPKPVCGGSHGHAGVGCGCAMSSCSHNCHSSSCSSCSHSFNGIHGLSSGFNSLPLSLRPNGINGQYRTSGSLGSLSGIGGSLAGSDIVLGPNSPFAGYAAAAAPADAVSLDIAYKMARENSLKQLQSEDKLNFGFRKIPVELPAKKILKTNVPEEQIFNLNGQIVELKPVKQFTSSSSATSLAEEAAEQLLQLQQEEADAEEESAGPFNLGPRRPTLGEIGFGAAKPPSPTLVDVPATSLGGGTGGVGGAGIDLDSCECNREIFDINTNCGCGSVVNFRHGYGGCGTYGGSGSCGGCATSCGCADKCKCKIIPGNVEYRTLPKPQQICLPVPEIPDSCESASIELSQEEVPTCSCIPVCIKKSCKSHCKKSCINFQRPSL